MDYRKPTLRIYVSKILLLSFATNTLLCFNFGTSLNVRAQSRPIVITADQPNVWTLEQAHYLLAQMHRRNLDLKAASLKELDPNAINGTHIDLLRTMFEFNASYNQGKAFDNELLAENKEFNAQRRQQLIVQRDRLNEENLALVRDIARLENQLKRKMPDEEKENLTANLDEKKAVQAAVKEQLTQTNEELKNLNAPSGEFKDTAPAAASSGRLPDATLKSVLDKAITAMDNKPSLNASLQLNNFLDMQYEILAKQLSLLRDEVGPGERLLFLEIPQSINSSRGKADKKWVQTWFKIAGYTEAGRDGQKSNNQDTVYGQVNNRLNKALVPIPAPTASPSPTPFPNCSALEPAKGETRAEHSQRVENVTQTLDSILGRDEENVRCMLSQFRKHESEINSLRGELARIKERTKNLTEQKSGLNRETEKEKSDEIEKELIKLNNEKAEKEPKLEEKEKESKQFEANLDVEPQDIFNLPDLIEKLNAENPNSLSAYILEKLIASGNGAAQFNEYVGFIKKKIAPGREQTDNLTRTLVNLFKSTDFNYSSIYSTARFESVAMSPETDKLLRLNPETGVERKLLNRLLIEAIFPNEIAPYRFAGAGCRENLSRFVNLDVTRPIRGLNRNVSNRLVRVVDVVPRQGSLNVNDVKLRTNESYFGVALSFLFGFGSSAKYKREREQFSQFVQQELYSSGFGKGAREFGWTFTPMPGASRVMPGVRTTYAIVIVPKEANSLVLESSGCYFPRSDYQPRDFENTQDKNLWREPTATYNKDDEDKMCTKRESFVVVIPNSGVDKEVFSVDSIEYKPVAANERVTVKVRGHNFPTQIGVLVGGTPLVQAIGLAQPLIYDDSLARKAVQSAPASSSEIKGEFERLSDEQISFWFQMPKDYQGTPPISLVAPGETKQLNYLRNMQVIDGEEGSKKGIVNKGVCTSPTDEQHYQLQEFYWEVLDKAAYMIGKRVIGGGKIDSINVFKADNGKVVVYVQGQNLNEPGASIYINGLAPSAADVVNNAKFWNVKFQPVSNDEFLHVTIAYGNEILTHQPVKNPNYKPKEPEAPGAKQDVLRIEGEPEFYEFIPESDNRASRLTVILRGFGFNDDLKVEPATASLIVEREDKAYLTLEAPLPFVKVKLTNVEKKAFAIVTVKRKELLGGKPKTKKGRRR